MFIDAIGQKKILLIAICMLSLRGRKEPSECPEVGYKGREQPLRDIRFNYRTLSRYQNFKF